MKFCAIIRNVQAAIMLTLATPLFAQAAPGRGPDPAIIAPQPEVLPTDGGPVLTPEPQINEPTVTPPPVIEPVPAPAPAPAPVPVPAPTPKPPVKKGAVDSLKPGQFMWEKRDSYEGRLKIVAVLDIQRIYVFHDDKLVGFSTMSAGKKGKETPTGIFKILQKNIDHKSNLYSNAPMPYMQRLTWDGIALHGGHIPGYPASHGCIRLPLAFAKALFGATQMEQEVFVLKDVNTPVKRPEPKPVPVMEPPVTQPVVAPPVVTTEPTPV